MERCSHGQGEKVNYGLRKLTDFSQIEMIYNTRMRYDFAPNELKPLDSMRQSWVKGSYRCYGLSEKDRIAGYAFFVIRERDWLLDYFAIEAEHRDQGLGSLFLRLLSECVQEADCLILEVEDPEAAENEETKKERERRLQFYLRNGCRSTELTSVLFGVAYRILEFPSSVLHTTDELRSAYAGIYRSTLPEPAFRTEFRLGSG